MFRKNWVIFWLFVSCLFIAQVHASETWGEVTDKEWDMLGNLVVTYFTGPTDFEVSKLEARRRRALGIPPEPVSAPVTLTDFLRAHTGRWQGAECTAFNSQNKPIGGGATNIVKGDVARVTISVPTKYQGKELRVDCKGL